MTRQILHDLRRRPVAAVAFVLYALAVARLTFSPGGAEAGRAVTWFSTLLTRLQFPATLADPSRVEVLLNVVMLMPLPMIGMWIWRNTNWRDWTAYAFLTSLTIEVVQIPIPTRAATYSDLAANTAGALVGGLLALAGKWIWESQELRRSVGTESVRSPADG